MVDGNVSEATETANLTQVAQALVEGTIETPTSGKMFGSAEALPSNLKSLCVPISEEMTNINELLANWKPIFTQNPSSGDAGPFSS